ncbi:MAG: dTMP kinase [Nanoarchaeota archaeon]
MKKRFFITFEGGEGSGKSTLAKLLSTHLEKEGYEVCLTKELGGNEVGEDIRKLLLNPKHNGKIISTAELLLFEAARAQFFENVVLPNLRQGKIVISDRCYDSTAAYQGYGRGLDVETIHLLNKLATQGVKPDLTYLIDVSVKLGLAKTTTSEFGIADRIEQEGLPFHRRVNQGYLELAKKEPNRIKVIPYLQNQVEAMHELIVKELPFLK